MALQTTQLYDPAQYAAALHQPTPAANLGPMPTSVAEPLAPATTMPGIKSPINASLSPAPAPFWTPERLRSLQILLGEGAGAMLGGPGANPTQRALASTGKISAGAGQAQQFDAMERAQRLALDPNTSTKVTLDANGVTLKATPQELAEMFGGSRGPR